MGSKIATCCYCGTRAALVLRGRDRHELACASCGAPLTRLKAMPQPDRPAQQTAARPGIAPGSRRRPAASQPRQQWPEKRQENTQYRRKRRKPLLSRVLEEVWDVVEDVFD